MQLYPLRARDKVDIVLCIVNPNLYRIITIQNCTRVIGNGREVIKEWHFKKVHRDHSPSVLSKSIALARDMKYEVFLSPGGYYNAPPPDARNHYYWNILLYFWKNWLFIVLCKPLDVSLLVTSARLYPPSISRWSLVRGNIFSKFSCYFTFYKAAMIKMGLGVCSALSGTYFHNGFQRYSLHANFVLLPNI